jgi:hypothetical protein
MFFRIKKSAERAYLQVVENKRVDGAVRQSVIANLGRADAWRRPALLPRSSPLEPNSATR